jgi:hypothetical protein
MVGLADDEEVKLHVGRWVEWLTYFIDPQDYYDPPVDSYEELYKLLDRYYGVLKQRGKDAGAGCSQECKRGEMELVEEFYMQPFWKLVKLIKECTRGNDAEGFNEVDYNGVPPYDRLNLPGLRELEEVMERFRRSE